MKKYIHFYFKLFLISLSLSLPGKSNDLGYKKISELTIKTNGLVVGCLFSDNGDEFMYWTEKNIFIYSLSDNKPILLQAIPYTNKYFYNVRDFDVFRCLFDSIAKIPNSFKSLKNYALIAQKYGRKGDLYPMIRYKQTICAIQNKEHEESNYYILQNDETPIYLDTEEVGTSTEAMSSFNLDTWWIKRSYPYEFLHKDKSLDYIYVPTYHIWKNRDGRVTSFIIRPSQVGIPEDDIDVDTAYITPSGKYIFILYGTSFIHDSGRYPSLINFIKFLIDSITKSQKFYFAIIDVEKERIIVKKQFSRYYNYLPTYRRRFSVSEKRNIYAIHENSSFKFYQFNLEDFKDFSNS